jgi:hypothetical protein
VNRTWGKHGFPRGTERPQRMAAAEDGAMVVRALEKLTDSLHAVHVGE